MLSVANSCDYNESSKKRQESFIEKCPPLGTYPKNSPPPGKSQDTKAPEWEQIFGANPPGVRGEGGGGYGKNW